MRGAPKLKLLLLALAAAVIVGCVALLVDVVLEQMEAGWESAGYDLDVPMAGMGQSARPGGRFTGRTTSS